MSTPLEPGHVMSREKFDTIKCSQLESEILSDRKAIAVRHKESINDLFKQAKNYEEERIKAQQEAK